jgi:hypothetical protein
MVAPTNPYIEASGALTYADTQIEVDDAGQIWTASPPRGSASDGLGIRSEIGNLVSFTASLGINTQPHTFNFTYVGEDVSNSVSIADIIEMTVKGMFVKGEVTHVDHQRSANGFLTNVVVQDVRTRLNNTVIDTFGIFDASNDPPNGVVDVKKLVFQEGLSARNLTIFSDEGATYQQMYDAVQIFGTELGKSAMPTPGEVAVHMAGNPDGFRWRVRGQPLLEFLNRVLNDLSFDFYFDTKAEKIRLIDRTKPVDIEATSFILQGEEGTGRGFPIISSKVGKDKGERPTEVRVYGGQMEGFIGGGGGQLPVSNDIAGQGFDLGVQGFDVMTFEPAWNGGSLRYFKHDGHADIDTPSEKEMRAALKGIEFWAMEKGLDNRIARVTTNKGGLPTRGFSPVGASGVNLIPNRTANIETAWVVDWYNRVRNYASNNFGRTFVLTGGGDLNQFEAVPEAWIGIENYPAGGGAFEDGYQIDDRFKFAAPFWNSTTNKLKAFAVIPGRVKWGTDGKGTPAQYIEYVEDNNNTYIPIEVLQWTSSPGSFSEDSIAAFEQDTGLMIRLPNICWLEYEEEDTDAKLQDSPVLNALLTRFRSSTALDLDNPKVLGTPLDEVAQVGIPIKVHKRFGVDFPETWNAGTPGDDGVLNVEIRDELAPWKFQPRGQQNSVDRMNQEGNIIAGALAVNRNFVTFGDIERVGLPEISFDNFAIGGEVTHGVTNMNVSISAGGYKTRYGLKSHFGQPVKKKPIEEKIEEDLAFALKRVEARIDTLADPRAR